VDSHLVLYSVNTEIAFLINENYYHQSHYVWCSPYFDCENRDKFLRKNPSSSNPFDIYYKFKHDIDSKDRHSSAIQENKAGLLKGVTAKKSQGIIDDNQEQEILEIIDKAQFEDFRPLIYVIPVSNVKGLGKLAPIKKRANPFSKEYIIEELPRHFFDMIDFERR
jgi:hypothetical protein